MLLPDIVLPVRPGESNEELRFALRSLVNLPHGRVWVVGHKPAWVKGVEFIPGNAAPHQRANLYRNLLLACRHPGVSDGIIVMNDDIYITEPVTEVPVLFRGRLADQVGRIAGRTGWWRQSLVATQSCLHAVGYSDPLSYELHVPFPADKEAMGETLERFAHVTPHNPPQWRTLYGVTCGISGVKHVDVKALRPGPVGRPYHSTDDVSFRYFRTRFTQLFPNMSPYERETDARATVVRRHLRSTRRAG